MKAMIFAAGLGTRFKPWTYHHPKALALVNGRSLLQRNIEYLQDFGIWDVVVNVHYLADQIMTSIREAEAWGSRIQISDERQELLETGGGLLKASGFFGGEAFVAMNVDVLTDLDLGAMIRCHQEMRPLATLAVSKRKSSRYFLFDGNEELYGWRNTRTGEERLAREGIPGKPWAFSGVQIVEPSLFPLLNLKGKFSLVDAYLELAVSHPIRSFDQGSARWIDVGRPESLDQAGTIFP
jgi:MurNAc alpha-1-phosphate uridylyltransferase